MSVLAKRLARKTPLMMPFCGEEITSTEHRLERLLVCFFLSFGLFMLLYVFPWTSKPLSKGVSDVQ